MLDCQLLWDVRWADMGMRSSGEAISCGCDLGRRCPPAVSLLLPSEMEENDLFGGDSCAGADVPSSGPPSRAGGSASVSRAINMGFWNARGFFMQVGLHAKPRRKHACFSALMREAEIVAVAEAHGHIGDLATVRAEHPGAYVNGSFLDRPGAGGVFVAVREHILRDLVEPLEFVELERGRAVQLRLYFRDARLRIVFVHLDPSLPLTQRRRAVRGLCAWASPQVGERVVIMGDLNVRSSTEPI